MRTKAKIILLIVLAVVAMVIAIGVGSVFIPPLDVVSIMISKLFGRDLPAHITAIQASIVWSLRVPRVLLAFFAGAALGVSGTIMQSVLKNPLASSFTLGVSSGASLGAFLVMVTGFTIPFLGMFTLPVAGLAFGLATVLLAVSFASRVDRGMQSHTIVLVGMVFSLFVNALLTLISALSKNNIERLYLWQLGSFAMKDLSYVAILAPVAVVGIALCACFHRELDLMTFGDEQAMSAGVSVQRVKWLLLIVAAALTGTAISLVGVISFIDLISPHVTRKIFSSAHRLVVPMSGLLAGAFMVLCDLIARTVASPSELPVGVVTALIGAPFFAYLYFRKRKDEAC